MKRLALMIFTVTALAACKTPVENSADVKDVTLSNSGDVYIITSRENPPKKIDDLVVYLCPKDGVNSRQECFDSVDKAFELYTKEVCDRSFNHYYKALDKVVVKRLGASVRNSKAHRERCNRFAQRMCEDSAKQTFPRRFIQETKLFYTTSVFDQEFKIYAEKMGLNPDLDATKAKLFELVAKDQNVVLRDKNKLKEVFGDGAYPLEFALRLRGYNKVEPEFQVEDLECSKRIGRMANWMHNELHKPKYYYDYKCNGVFDTWNRSCSMYIEHWLPASDRLNTTMSIAENTVEDVGSRSMKFSRSLFSDRDYTKFDESLMDEIAMKFMSDTCKNSTGAATTVRAKKKIDNCDYSLKLSPERHLMEIYGSCDFVKKVSKFDACSMTWKEGDGSFEVRMGLSDSSTAKVVNNDPLQSMIDYVKNGKNCK